MEVHMAEQITRHSPGGLTDSLSLYQSTLIDTPGAVETTTRQKQQPSYHPTGWILLDRLLDSVDTLTGKRAGWFQRLFSFLFVGGLGALVNIACFSFSYTRLERSFSGLAAYTIAFFLATEVSILLNFVLNDRITFRHLHRHEHTWQLRCARFHITSIGGTLLTLGISFSLLHLLHVPAVFAQAIALIIATAFNFVFHHLFTYQHRQKKTAELLADHAAPSRPQQSHSLNALIIIPTYNEYENLPLLLKDIFAFAPDTDVLVVDDNSPDGTGELAEQLSRENTHVHVLHRPGKLGLGTAYIAGFKYAIARGYDVALEMDADFSHGPHHLPDIIAAIEHADLVIGSRYIAGGATPNWSFSRRFISGCGNVFARFMLGIPLHDCTGGFRCYRKRVLENIDLDSVQSHGYAFQVEMTYRVFQSGFKIVETPITFVDRRLGKSKMSRAIVIEAFIYVLRARFSKHSAPGSA